MDIYLSHHGVPFFEEYSAYGKLESLTKIQKKLLVLNQLVFFPLKCFVIYIKKAITEALFLTYNSIRFFSQLSKY